VNLLLKKVEKSLFDEIKQCKTHVIDHIIFTVNKQSSTYTAFITFVKYKPSCSCYSAQCID